MKTVYENGTMVTASPEDSDKTEDVSIEIDPWNPPYEPRPAAPRDLDMVSQIKLVKEWINQTEAMIAAYRATHTIIPDRTPQVASDAFFNILRRLEPILEKDSVRLFLRLFDQRNGFGMAWGFVITPQTLNQIVKQNAVRCAKVVLEGKAPELRGHRANPNYMNRYGYFPLHQAAEIFSVDMIKLLFSYGASANLRTAGPDVTENLLPLHIAVENTCLHKFLEDNLFPYQEKHLDYNEADANNIYKLIHLLCLPEMKIFLDTTRLLAEKTDSLVDEIWKYIEGEKLAQAAVLLLAAQRKIRGSSCKGNGTNKMNGFSIIMKHIMDHTVALDATLAQNRRAQKQLKAKRKHFSNSLMLVHVISQAGGFLDTYIQAHPEVTHVMRVSHGEVLERVSSILKSRGFFPTEGGINIGSLCPYEHALPNPFNEGLPDRHGNAVAEMHYLHPAAEKAGRKKQPRGWDLKYTRSSFFPYWRSILSPRLVRIMPQMLSLEQIDSVRNESAGNGFSLISNRDLDFVGRFPQLRSYQPIKPFGAAGALTAMKILKNA